MATRRVTADREATTSRGETFYHGPSRSRLATYPPKERWDDWVELDSRAWPRRVEHHYMLVPTTCFNFESACGLLAYVDRDTLQVRKFEVMKIPKKVNKFQPMARKNTVIRAKGIKKGNPSLAIGQRF